MSRAPRTSMRPESTLGRALVAATALLSVGAPAAARAQSLTASEILTQFNAVITTSFTSGHDVEGRLVAGQIVGGATFYNKPNPASAPSTFAAVNALSVGAGVDANVNNGGNVNVPVGNNAGHFNFNGGGYVTTPAFTMSAFTTPLNALSAGITALQANSTVNTSDLNNYKFQLNPNANGQAIFRIDAATLALGRNFSFIGNAGTIIVDVTGDLFAQDGASNFNASNELNRSIIWNFAGAQSLAFKFWHGAILAPQGAVTNTSPLEGMLYAHSFAGGGELHDFPFQGSTVGISSVPEPSTVSLLGVALVGTGVATWRRRRQGRTA